MTSLAVGSVVATGRGLADFETTHDFQDAQEARMVPLSAALGGTGIEKLLGTGGIGQRKVKRTCAGQSKIQVLLVQFDAEARIEVALDHALAMDLQDTRRGETTHQSLPHAGRVS